MKALLIFVSLLACLFIAWKKNVFKNFPNKTNQIITLNQITSNPQSDTIYYSSNRQLNWDDFKGKPLAKGRVIAETNSGFGYSFVSKDLLLTKQIKCDVYSFFIKSGSWKLKNKVDVRVLKHEQGHFDLTHFIANSFKAELENLSKQKNITKEEVNILYNDYTQQLSVLQDRYDNETEHGTNVRMQKYWNNKIKDLLSE